MTEYEKMLNGEVFDGADPEVSSVRDKAFELTAQINCSTDFDLIQDLLKELIPHLGEGSLIRTPFHCEFGKQIKIGEGCFLNLGVLMLDGAEIIIGNNVMIGPSVQLYTASHSIDHLSRRNWETFCQPITIGDDVWIGGNAVINSGVTIGNRSIVAASSVLNQDVPPDCMVGGIPAKVIKSLKT